MDSYIRREMHSEGDFAIVYSFMHKDVWLHPSV